MNFVNYFDHIYCINLSRRIDRWEECKLEFSKINTLDKVERFDAADGQILLPNRKRRGRDNVGVFGCNYSHLNVIRDAIKNKYHNILILEDDVEFIPNFLGLFDKYSEEIKEISWDLLYLGGNYSKFKHRANIHIYQPKRVFTTHAYGISNKLYVDISTCLERGIDCYMGNKRGLTVIDKELNTLVHNHKISRYCFYPKLVWQRESYSDLRHAVKDYDVLRK